MSSPFAALEESSGVRGRNKTSLGEEVGRDLCLLSFRSRISVLGW